MNYIVLDMEWNQPSNPKKLIKKPIILYGEIIQIGAVKLDENFCIIDTFKIMVTPTHYKEMNKNVSKLTKITTEQLQYGFCFTYAFKQFRLWCGNNFTFLIWGDNDIEMLRDNMILYGLNTGWIPDSYNIQHIFADQVLKEHRPISLSKAMQKIGEPILEAHDALNDARNTACICQHLDVNKGIEEYSNIRQKQKFNLGQSTDRIPIKKAYSTTTEALKDKELKQFSCPLCGAEVECTDFVRQNSEKYICLGKCSNNDELFIRIKFIKKQKGKYNAVRILYERNDENTKYYMSKKQSSKEKEEIHKINQNLKSQKVCTAVG